MSTIYYFAHITADRITPESAEFGSPAESGWVESVGDRGICESSNYVRPERFVVSDLEVLDHRDEFTPDVAAWVANTLEALGAYEYGERSTFYGTDSDVDYVTGETFTYAIHFSANDGTARSLTAEELGSSVKA